MDKSFKKIITYFDNEDEELDDINETIEMAIDKNKAFEGLLRQNVAKLRESVENIMEYKMAQVNP